MNNFVVILGSSGNGKSSSIKSLDPKETFIINVLNKNLPFKGSKKKTPFAAGNAAEAAYR